MFFGVSRVSQTLELDSGSRALYGRAGSSPLIRTVIFGFLAIAGSPVFLWATRGALN